MNITAAQIGNATSVKPVPQDTNGDAVVGSTPPDINQPDFASLFAAVPTKRQTVLAASDNTRLPNSSETPLKNAEISPKEDHLPLEEPAEDKAAPNLPIASQSREGQPRSSASAELNADKIAVKDAAAPPPSPLPTMSFAQLTMQARSTLSSAPSVKDAMAIATGISQQSFPMSGQIAPAEDSKSLVGDPRLSPTPSHSPIKLFSPRAEPSTEKSGTSLLTNGSKAGTASTHTTMPAAGITQQATALNAQPSGNAGTPSLSPHKPTAESALQILTLPEKTWPTASTTPTIDGSQPGKTAHARPNSAQPMLNHHQSSASIASTYPIKPQGPSRAESARASMNADVSTHNERANYGIASVDSIQTTSVATPTQPKASVLFSSMTIERSSSVLSPESLLAPSDTPEISNWESQRSIPAHHIASAQPRADIAPHVARQLVDAMGQAIHKPVEIALSPAELGRVRMSVVAEDGKITVNILAERPDTLDLMRRHIDQLGQTYRSMGYEQVSFSFGQGAENSGEAGGGAGGDASGKPASLEGADAAHQAETDIIQLDHAGTDGIDIRL